ncbi:TetR/AcrR family transcriptional regulator [Prosthecobacter sp.]|uniref:TetR/AcrR family transcriptional regulator n=1 Tax=Prosthecobacter sp. TaxID=1965333 RepID=UPI002ABA97BA|nr:TetR/AcrR family transcriptional regulator [Prosthecobacter sp.]MDZ4404878.1 TetR/AcrR family transcriptional regulator [Prosthecobacter sp.]
MPKKAASKKRERDPAGTRQGLIDATVRLMLKQGFAGTSVDLICKEAGMTKGSFFHHFESKEAIGKAAVEWWGQMGTALYAVAWNNAEADPLEQVHQMLDIMTGFTMRKDEACVCMVGMMSQELAATNPIIQAACAKELHSWTDNVAKMLAAAKKKRKPDSNFDPKAVAWFLNSLWQGSMLVGKACESQAMIRANLKLARGYVDGLFGIHTSN